MPQSELIQQITNAGLRRPRVLTFAITGACNLACEHCWVRGGETSSAPDVPLATASRILHEFAAVGGTGIRLTGGEPLCHPHWLDLLQLCRTVGFRQVYLQTNAMLFSHLSLAEVRTLDFPGLEIQVSLDGASAHTHDLVRGAGSFDAALRGIDRLAQAGLAAKLSVFFTEMHHNLGDIPYLLDLADSIGIGSVASGALVRCGRASGASRLAPATIDQYQSLLARYESDFRFRELYQRIGSVAVLGWRTASPVRDDCCTFVENPYLTPSGRLFPCLLCHADTYSVTDVFAKGLGAAFGEGVPLWSSLKGISHRRSEEISQCRDCPGRHCCAGGCMGRAWGSFADLLAADDRCVIRKFVYQHPDSSSW